MLKFVISVVSLAAIGIALDPSHLKEPGVAKFAQHAGVGGAYHAIVELPEHMPDQRTINRFTMQVNDGIRSLHREINGLQHGFRTATAMATKIERTASHTAAVVAEIRANQNALASGLR